METTETEKKWSELTDFELKACLAAHCTPLGLSWRNSTHVATLRRLFDLARPKIVLVYLDGKLESCRIHEDSANVVKVIVREYL